MLQKSTTLMVVTIVLVFFDAVVCAKDKVVVVPMCFSDESPSSKVLPSFRLVPYDVDVNYGYPTSGRLEYTSDPNPRASSEWGSVCLDCFAGDRNCTVDTPNSNAAALAVCKELGFEMGRMRPTIASPSSAVSRFTLDDVRCPELVNDFSQCTYSVQPKASCSTSHDAVFIECNPRDVPFEFSTDRRNLTIYKCDDFVSTPDVPVNLNIDFFGTDQPVLIDDTDPANPRFVASGSPDVGITVEGAFFPNDDNAQPPTLSFQINSGTRITPLNSIPFTGHLDRLCDVSYVAVHTTPVVDSISVTGRRWRISFPNGTENGETQFANVFSSPR